MCRDGDGHQLCPSSGIPLIVRRSASSDKARPAFPRTLRDTFIGVRELKGQAIVAIGLLLLIAAPIMRVAVSIFIFLYQKDRIFTLITSIVLFLLLASFALGRISRWGLFKTPQERLPCPLQSVSAL